MGGFQVDADRLRAHAATLLDAGAELREAHAAASRVLVGDAAFGELCSVLGNVVELVRRPACDALGEAALTVTHARDGVLAMAAGYDHADAVASTALRRLVPR